jgi:uncharacterized membrane protein
MCMVFGKLNYMAKRIIGIILTLLGIFGLVFAGVQFMNGTSGNRDVKEIVIYGLLGAIFFFSGVGLVRGTHDKPQ